MLAPIRKFGPSVFDGIRPTKLSELTAITKEVTNFIAAKPQQDKPQQYNSQQDQGSPKESDGHYNHWRGDTIPEWTDSAINTFVTCIEKAPAGWSMGVGHYMHGTPCAVNQATPILRDEHSSSHFFNMSWGHSSHSGDAMAWVDRSIKDMQQYNRAGAYINYFSFNTPEAVVDAYDSNYPRLRKLKSQYDAENSFHLNRNIRA